MSRSTIELISGNGKDFYTEQEIKAAFPDIDPGFLPFGTRVIVQLRSARIKTKGGILLADESIETEKWNTQVAKVRAVGPLAYRYQDGKSAGKLFHEGAWCDVGDFVRVPKYLQDKWSIKFDDHEVLFMMVDARDILAKMTCNPLEIKAYI